MTEANSTNGHRPGFRLPERTARLVFEGEYAGAEVVVRLSVPLALYMQLGELAETQKPQDLGTAFAAFSRDVLVEWNLEYPDGRPLPADLTLVPLAFATLVLEQWTEAAAKSPLGVAS